MPHSAAAEAKAIHAERSAGTGRVPADAPPRQLLLDNGLSTVWEEDHRQPLIAIDARILGGLRGEGRYLGAGITHFLEHLLFKGTTTRAPGTIDHEVRGYGGSINAFTSFDYTGVSLFVESRYLKDALGMLADILQHATFPPEEFAKEREVIISEIQMNQDDPERRIHHLFWNRHLLVHPYRHPILGYQSLLEGLTVEDLRAFYHSQYVPNNVVVSVVGDLDSAAMPSMLHDAFASWPRGAPYQILTPSEPETVSPKRGEERLPIQAAHVMAGFPAPRFSHPDVYALDVLAAVLGQGRSSRFYEELVRARKLAQVASASNYTPFDPGVFGVYLRTEPAQADAAVEAALAQIETIQERGISAKELNKAKRQVEAGYWFGRQTIEAKAGDLASSLALSGDPEFSKRYTEKIEQVRVEDVRRVARQYLSRSSMTLVRLAPAHAAASAGPSAAVDRPRVSKTELANGLRVVIGQDRHLPISAIVVALRGGVRAETDETQGLSNLVAQMLLKGTARETASQIAETVESMGGGLEAFSGRDGFGISLHLLSRDLEAGVALAQELLTSSTFPEEELTLQRQLVLQELQSRDDDIFDVGSRLMRRTLFLTHPYRFDPMGSPETVGQFSRADCQAFAKRWLVPRNLVVAVFSDLDDAAAIKMVTPRFGRLTDVPVEWPALINSDHLEGVREASRVMAKEQSVIMMGFRGARLTDPDRDVLDVLTAVLSGMSGRLFQEVRERQGLAYTLGASHVPGWDPGYLVAYAATRPEERDKTLRAMQRELERMAQEPVGDDELDRAKRYLIGSHRLDVQSLESLARRAALDELYGLGYDAWTTYESRIGGVTAAMVQQAAARYLQLPHRAQVMVGPNGVSATDGH